MSDHDSSGTDAQASAATGPGGRDDDTASNSTSTGRAQTAPDTGSPGRDGPRFVLALYGVLVGIATAAGFLTGTFVDGLRSPKFLFLLPFPATPLGFAAYGGLTIALALGVPLVLVVYVSRTVES